ncbi:hypothetical protein LOTGIDRAFT_156798 [Lottia gigantea]|uniref:Uncharacterized protein n=1 Tax=Lottia gigantea TaxID=225164 RepID=V4AYU1_LOTGI|nr:hypothetical protein LOTGIDRAFT_156798 [Lottia gigantea]ESP02848.1 hypothetical protein LOTGIDRAFT_156798 [Lottia gigantea]
MKKFEEMFPIQYVKGPSPLDVYLNQIARQMVDHAFSSAETHRSMLTMETDIETENAALNLKVLNKDEEDSIQSTATKSSVLAVYTANINQADGNIDSGKTKKGKKVELKPDCGKLTDGITDAITDDEASDMYDDLIKQLGLEQEKSKDVPDHLNPFKLGYLNATPPPPVPVSRFRRILRSIRKAITRPFSMCRRSSRYTEDDDED